MTIYGKEQALGLLQAMRRSDRLPHSFLLYGPTGAGKKTLARYLAAQLLCEAEEAPCFLCRSCRTVCSDQHPDVITVAHSGKLGGFSVDTIRHVCSDAYVVPNNGARKVYLFEDADRITVQAQNALLKLVEEPPDCTYFIFTAADKHVFLDTILSRVSSIGVMPCSESECRTALTELGYSDTDAAEAITAFHGNLGQCLSYLTSEDTKRAVERIRVLSDCLVRRDEYGLLVALTAASGDKQELRLCLNLFDRLLRDAIVLRSGSGTCIGCDPHGAMALSSRLTLKRVERMHRAISDTMKQIEGNVSPALAVSALCGAVMQAGGL
ncbi:MAG: AAA family ATPase [Ruminococcus sp.]|nr:AAA family ATPase [Ruminococcus sp.]